LPTTERGPLALLAAHALASLLHHVHNAEFLKEYPDLPTSLTPAGVYAAWAGEAVIALAGLLLLRFGRTGAGLALIGSYALIGFSGLAHYIVAPLPAHTFAMNATIGLEVVTAAFLLAAVIRRMAG
jgi:hypothetical protein